VQSCVNPEEAIDLLQEGFDGLLSGKEEDKDVNTKAKKFELHLSDYLQDQKMFSTEKEAGSDITEEKKLLDLDKVLNSPLYQLMIKTPDTFYQHWEDLCVGHQPASGYCFGSAFSRIRNPCNSRRHPKASDSSFANKKVSNLAYNLEVEKLRFFTSFSRTKAIPR
jgi:hypothetical protein